jgi:hypothetical protein
MIREFSDNLSEVVAAYRRRIGEAAKRAQLRRKRGAQRFIDQATDRLPFNTPFTILIKCAANTAADARRTRRAQIALAFV